MSTEKVLLVGGPHDGQRREVSRVDEYLRTLKPIDDVLVMAHPTADPPQLVPTDFAIYKRSLWTAPKKDTYDSPRFPDDYERRSIFALDGMTPVEVLDALIAGYRTP